MLIDYPDRAHHGLFQLPVFQSQAFTDYMNGMKHHLEESQAPYDARIDQVLPGVHSRMDGMGSNLNYVMHKVDRHETEMVSLKETMPRDFREVLNFFWQDAVNDLAFAVNSPSRTTRRSTSLPAAPPTATTLPTTTPPTARTTPPTARTTPPQASNLSPIHSPGYGYRLPAKPRSATDVWHAWHGIGSFENMPVCGGIPTMELNHPGWRKMYSSTERRHFSRWKITIELMDEEIVLLGNTKSALQGLDEIYKNSITPFMKCLQKRKKERSSEGPET